jgi:hypothetical protein
MHNPPCRLIISDPFAYPIGTRNRNQAYRNEYIQPALAGPAPFLSAQAPPRVRSELETAEDEENFVIDELIISIGVCVCVR